MQKVRALIVDDSVVYRTQIRAALQLLPWVEVVGTASNGWAALERIPETKPDLVILDLEMPSLDGLKTLEKLAQMGCKAKILVFSSQSERGARITMDALEAGASDFIAKPGSLDRDPAARSLTPAEKIKALMLPKLKAFFPRQAEGVAVVKSPPKKEHSAYPTVVWDLFQPEIVVIGSSTGGPTVLEKVFTSLAAPLRCPMVIVQHMPPIFTAMFAERLAKASGLDVQEARDGDLLETGRVYLAPGDYHLRLTGTAPNVRLRLDQGPLINSVRPAVDPLFETAAERYRHRCLAFVLTGMGADGRAGAEAIKRAGGAVVIQDEASCVVFGMPGAVRATGAYDKIGNPQEIIEILRDKVGSRPIGKKAAGWTRE